MNLTKAIEQLFKKYLPSPFTIAVLLTFLTLILALVFTENTSETSHLFYILSLWETGIWNNALLVFAYQMMLILVLGHVLVLSRPMEVLILKLTRFVTNSANAAVLVALPTMLVSFFNWGLGLIFGAILARKVGEYAQKHGIAINYPLIGACGYVGLMVWHGGISGSAPLKVAEEGHLSALMSSVISSEMVAQLPASISTAETIFSLQNLVLFAGVVLAITALAYRLGKRTRATTIKLKPYKFETFQEQRLIGAEQLDGSKIFAWIFAAIILGAFAVQYFLAIQKLSITPNMLNFFMLGLAILLHGNFKSFLRAVETAIGDTAGILIQFPLYFGIMGVMSGSGMINTISESFVAIASPITLPIFSFFSAAIVNVFVPSGGGQWAVQGPIVVESAIKLGVPLPKAVMALAYGDQITNMLQPFWALPLLGITKLKAKEILPYTLLFMIVGIVISVIGLLIF